MILNLEVTDNKLWIILPNNRSIEINPKTSEVTIRPKEKIKKDAR